MGEGRVFHSSFCLQLGGPVYSESFDSVSFSYPKPIAHLKPVGYFYPLIFLFLSSTFRELSELFESYVSFRIHANLFKSLT